MCLVSTARVLPPLWSLMSPFQGGNPSNRHLTANRLQQPVEARRWISRNIQGDPGLFRHYLGISRIPGISKNTRISLGTHWIYRRKSSLSHWLYSSSNYCICLRICLAINVNDWNKQLNKWEDYHSNLFKLDLIYTISKTWLADPA